MKSTVEDFFYFFCIRFVFVPDATAAVMDTATPIL
jgi:hypothetical protein